MRVLSTGLEWFGERPGGLSRYFEDFISSMVKNGDEVQALVATTATPLPKNAHMLAPHYVKGIPARRSGMLSIRQKWRSEVLNELTSSCYDLFNPHFAYYAWGAMNLLRHTDMPIVTHFHGPWAFESRVGEMGLQNKVRFYVQKVIESRVYRSSDRFIVLSEAFRDILSTDYGIPNERIDIVPGAVDVQRFQLSADRERVRGELRLPYHRTILVSVRRLVRRMGLENLVEAVKALVDDFPSLLLVVVGTGPLEEKLRSLVKEERLENHVWLRGRATDEDLPKYYQAADFSVVPSVALEGFGLVTAESLACGTPVLGTPVGGMKELLSGFNSRLLFSGTQVQDLIDGIRATLDRPSDMPTADQCRNYVLQNHTWPVVTGRIRKVFLRAMADKGEFARQAPIFIPGGEQDWI